MQKASAFYHITRPESKQFEKALKDNKQAYSCNKFKGVSLFKFLLTFFFHSVNNMEQANQVVLCDPLNSHRHIQSGERTEQVTLEVLNNISEQMLERRHADQQFSGQIFKIRATRYHTMMMLVCSAISTWEKCHSR